MRRAQLKHRDIFAFTQSGNFCIHPRISVFLNITVHDVSFETVTAVMIWITVHVILSKQIQPLW
jgi:hypothetical protein